jgi:molybdopterin-synthase adenylyltransferase
MILRPSRARVAELADAQDLGSCGVTRGGSSPPLRTKFNSRVADMSDPSQDREESLRGRYDRQIRVQGFGSEAQERIGRARVGIVGCGALGSRVAEDLARAGIGYLRIIDRDFVEVGNLHRQYLFDEQAALNEEPKVLAAAQRLAEINSQIEVSAELCDLGPGNAEALLLDLDLWIDGTDNFQTRYLLNDLAVREGRHWIYGACVGVQSMSAAFLAGGSCLRCLFPDPPPAGSTETCETAGILPPAAGFTTSIQSGLALQLLGNPDSPPESALISADLATFEIRSMKLPKKSLPHCKACGESVYPALAMDQAPQARALCGRNAIQLSAPVSGFPDLGALADRLDGSLELERNAYMLRLLVPEGRITVFRGGRAIIEGTEDPGRARALFDRYLGT